MSENKEFVKDITKMDEDFAQWYLCTSKRMHGYETIWICTMGKYTRCTRSKI